MAGRISYDQVQDYLRGLTPERPPEFHQMEAYAREHGFPAIEPMVGLFCYLQARLVEARTVFELGSGYGYSTAWFARAVHENGGGIVHHTVWDEGLSQKARRHLGALGYDGIVRFHVSEAVQALRETPGPFDLIFNDIDKTAYPDSLPVIADKLRPGGVLIVDNMLLGGSVLDPDNTGENQEGVREFTRLISTDPGWVVSLVPISDGMLVARKQG